MARKVSKTKHKNGSGVALGKQKQKQSQKVIVNITQPKRVYSKSLKGKEEKTQGSKSFIPLMPSFNINQPTSQSTPSPSTDLAKILGMLIPKLQTESTLGSAISTPTQIPTSTKENIGGLINTKETPSFIDAINTVSNSDGRTSSLKKEPLSDETLGALGVSLGNIYQEPESEFEYVNEDIKRLSRLKRFENPFYDQETEAEGVPLVEAEVKPKRKYTKSGKYSKKQPKEFSEFQKE